MIRKMGAAYAPIMKVCVKRSIRILDYFFFFFVSACISSTASFFIKRLFRRAALFLWMIFFSAALSSALKAWRVACRASSRFPSAISSCAFLMKVRALPRYTRLWILRFSFCRFLLIWDLMFANFSILQSVVIEGKPEGGSLQQVIRVKDNRFYFRCHHLSSD